MFLFTTPPTREAAPVNPVVDAIRRGAEKTGTSFDYLLNTAQRESALNPRAKAPTSSASGLFQFVEQTWLGLLKSDGGRLGLSEYANAVSARGDGTYTVQDPGLRQQILSLREDPTVASAMAGALTQRNREQLTSELGREPSAGELYIAHFLGGGGASELIKAAKSNPTRAAATDFPDAAAANRSIFFDRSGRARGAGEVYALLAAGQGAEQQVAAQPAFAPDKPLAFARQDGPAFHGLFQTEGRTGPISDAVARLWNRGNAANGGTRTASVTPFYPRSSGVDLTPETPAEPEVAPSATPIAANVPLPPVRPDDLLAGSKPALPAKPGQPLDLSRFMTWRRP